VGYRLLGLGASAGSGYLDPLRDPFTYVTQIPGRLAFLVGAMLIGGNADLWVMRPDFRPAMILIAVVITLIGGLLLRAVWQTPATTEQHAARWLLAGALLSAIPFAGSVIGLRCLVVPWIGGSVAVALVLTRWWTALRPRAGAYYRLVGVLCWGLAIIHLGFAPVQRLAMPFLLQRLMFRDLATAVQDPDLGLDRLAGRSLVILNAPDFRIGLHAFFFLKLYRLPMPASWRVLSWTSCSHRFHRLAADTIDMELVGGEVEAPHLTKGQVIDVAGMRATVTEMDRRGPTRVRFRFDRPLEDPNFVFAMWKDGHLQLVEPPAIGMTLEVPWRLVNPL
jgi:hypothetical protein